MHQNSLPSPDLPYRLIVFDWDGTLMDSIATIAACADHARRDVGVDEPNFPRLIRQAIGLGLDQTALFTLPNASAAQQAAWVERYRFRWIEQYREQPLLFPGARETVAALAAAGYWLAIATGKGRTGLERDLQATGVGDYFLATRTVNEAPSKPSPVMLLEILAELGVREHEALMVGDTTFDLDMATNARMGAVGVLSGTHDRATLESRQPLALLDDASHLPAWLGGRVGGAQQVTLSEVSR